MKVVVVLLIVFLGWMTYLLVEDNSKSPLTTTQTANANPIPLQTQQAKSQTQETTSQPALSFEYLGLKLGMDKAEVSNVIERFGDRPSVAVYENAAGRLYGIQENLWKIMSYVPAFTQKYGPPRVEQRTYRNGLGNEFHANVWTWEHPRESLTIHELCVGDVLQPQKADSGEVYGVPWSNPIGPCLVLYSGVYAPKQALPEI